MWFYEIGIEEEGETIILIQEDLGGPQVQIRLSKEQIPYLIEELKKVSGKSPGEGN